MYNQPEVDAKRAKVWLRTCSKSELKLRVVLKRPLAKEMPNETKNGWDHRLKQLGRMKTLVEQAEHILPPDSPVLGAGRKRLERIRGLPLHADTEETRRLAAEADEAANIARRAERDAAEAADEEDYRQKREGRRNVPQFAKFCDCGQEFARDGITCKKCGSLRKEVEAGVLPAVPTAMTASA